MPVCRAAPRQRAPAVLSAEVTSACVSIHTLFRVIYNEVIQTSKYYMRDVTAIESAWLLELAPHFYQQGTVRLEGTWPQANSSLFIVLSVCVFHLSTLDHSQPPPLTHAHAHTHSTQVRPLLLALWKTDL